MHRIVGREFASGADLQAALSMFKGNSFAKGALDTAWWALQVCMSPLPLGLQLCAARG